MPGNLIISPISIDLGAKNTGVYFAHYPEGSSIEEIEKEGRVYQLEKDSYTLLMAHRTARRHQRRGFDRRQMVKRLFKLIWEKHFGLEWDKNVQQTTSFLFNRRGFSFLTEEYDVEVLSRFPEEAYEQLPEQLKIDHDKSGLYNFADALSQWTNSDNALEKIRGKFHRILFKTYCEKIRKCWKDKTTNDQTVGEGRDSAKLGNTPKDIFEELFQELPELKERIETEEYTFENKRKEKVTARYNRGEAINVLSFVNNNSVDVANKIVGKLPPEQTDWLFNPFADFDLEKSKERLTSPENSNIKLHLQHLTFALHKTLNELQSGGRHRSNYFGEIEDVLKNENHTHKYLEKFCAQLQSGRFKPQDSDSPLTVEALANLIGHLSNLELKPLRKYFNDGKHKTGDLWCEDHLNKIFDRWVMREWRINPDKDKDKLEDKRGDYKKLRKDWKAHNGSVVDFWLATGPFTTIPPYQDNNNRRPPRCQSLILNPTFLNNNYSQWQVWLGELKKLATVQEHLGDFEVQLKSLKSGKEQSYFSDEKVGKLKKFSGHRTHKDLDARILQFIFDRIKANDSLKLNEIYSHAKKYRQEQSTERERKGAKNKLERAIEDSELPDMLKTSRNHQNSSVFEQGSFLHLICKYYKIRQKARDGRVFIQPEYRYVDGRGYENTRRFDDKDHLLIYCNHKPRQKRYQILGDLAGLLQVAPVKLKDVVEGQHGETLDEKLFNWLNGIDHLKTNCDRASKEQKDRRGRLKLDIQKIADLIYHQSQSCLPSATEIKKILSKSRVDEASRLHSFCERARNLCLTVTQPLYDDSKQRQWQQDLNRNPAIAVYLLAQINSIAFKERSGNANTCAVCSTDNAQRMQMAASKDDRQSNAKAQRLPAIETRLIDGAVMRMARIVGDVIAEDKWKRIEGDLKAGQSVCVPIITESNRFEFEPSLKEIKGKKPKDVEKKNRSEGQERISVSKDERIKEASRGICPYTGAELGDAGDQDHIIPRSSEWGILNDEANLIWASDEGNKQVKKDKEFSLADLNSNYKQKQFQTSDDQEIKQWIIEQIGDGRGENFQFGPYRNFINLTPDQQKAFRHALFLVGDPLREKVIKAIDNRTRTFVNGTQRYFAEVLANKLYKKARAIDRQNLLSFDYFGVEAQDSSRGDGIYHLRKRFETINPEVQNYRKDNGKAQEPYSHLIDAQLAFSIVADAHRNEGGLKLRIDNSVSLWPVDGTVANTIFNAIRVAPDELRPRKLERRKPDEKYFSHRSIHRDSMYAEHYVPILIDKEKGEVHIGFDWNNSYALRDTKPDRITLYFVLQQFGLLENSLHLTKDTPFHELPQQLANAGFSTETNYFSISLNVQAIHAYYIENYNTAKGYQSYPDEMKFLRSLAYRTEKKKITTLEEVQNVLNKARNFQVTIKKLALPAKREWQRLVDEWEKTDLENDDFLRQFFRVSESRQSHEKVRKVFSLPIKTGEGKILLKRRSWNGEDIFQIVNDSDSRTVDAKIFIPIFVESKGSIAKLLSESARSKKLFLLDEAEYYDRINDDITEIDPTGWHPIELDDRLSSLGIAGLEYRIDNNTRPQVRLTFNKRLEQEKIETILGHPLLKPKEKERLKTQLQEVTEEDKIIEYTGSGFQQGIKQKLLPVLQEHYSRNVSS